MLTYQVRQRTFKAENSLTFPNSVSVCFRFKPNTAFGNHGADGRTWKQSTPGRVVFNANTGRFRIEPQNSIEKLDVCIQHSNITFHLQANELTVTTTCESNAELTELIESIYYGFPFALSLKLKDPIVIDRVEGAVGDDHFAWELASWNLPILISTQNKQEELVASAWELHSFLAEHGNRRLVAAFRYLHNASRLLRAGHTPWEFLSESLLSFVKVLETLFPPTGDGATRDAVREGLNKLGYDAGEIEKYFIPAMLLRNEIDVGHVFLGIFTRKELTILHLYTELIEDKWFELIERVVEKVKTDEDFLASYGNEPANENAKRIVEAIDTALNSRGQ